MRGDKVCPFSGVTNYRRVSRKGAGKWGLECSDGVITMTQCKHALTSPGLDQSSSTEALHSSKIQEMQTHKRPKTTLNNMTIHSVRIFGVSIFFKRQNNS